MKPQTFNDWKKCIVNDCKINLTPEFATLRLRVYEDKQNAETKKFISLYGEQHLQNIITWFNEIASK
jgi:hypothetical protein